jgi:hypothetical protein
METFNTSTLSCLTSEKRIPSCACTENLEKGKIVTDKSLTFTQKKDCWWLEEESDDG